MKLCSISPVKNLDITFENDICMLLAHLSKNDENYAVYARNYAGYKIMDNSIIELGDAFSMDELIEQAKKCEVDEIILPDEYENWRLTVKKAKESIKWLKKNKLIGYFNLMAVCHGKNRKEFKKCFKRLNRIKEINVIGIPKVTTKWQLTGSRKELYDIYSKTHKEIHLLGVWDNLSELLTYTREQKKRIRSVDTCLPCLLAIQDKKIFNSRNGTTINLETDIVDMDKYNKIRNEIKEALNM